MSEPNKVVVPTSEIDSILNDHVNAFVKWYWEETAKYQRLTTWLQASIAFFTSWIAPEWARWAVVVLSAFTTLLTSFLYMSARTARLREQGRIEITALQQKTRSFLGSQAMTLTELGRYRLEIIEKVANIEHKFGAFIPAQETTPPQPPRESEKPSHRETAPISAPGEGHVKHVIEKGPPTDLS